MAIEMSSDMEDEDVHHASFLRAHMADSMVPSPVLAPSIAEGTQENGELKTTLANGNGDDSDDEDERPRAVPGTTQLAPPPPPHARTQATAHQPLHAHTQSITYQPSPFAAAAPPTVHMPVDEFLCVSTKCTARNCFRLQWEAEMNPRCRDKTALNVENKIYLFDGFYILCHDDTPEIPQFEYTRGGVMCRIRFVREPLPQSLLPPDDSGGGSITSPHGCHVMFLLKRYLFQQLLGIQSQHLFQTVFADATRATGDRSDYCSDFHLLPRFISLSDAPLLNKEDLLAPHRIGFAVGRFLPIEHVLGCLEAAAMYPVQAFLETSPAKALVDMVVSTRINGVPGVFRVDELVYEDTQATNEKPVPPRRVVHLKHVSDAALGYDGVASMKRVREWMKLGDLIQTSPSVAARTELLAPAECHLTGLRADVLEVGSAMPMVLKYVRHYKLLASFAAEFRLRFQDRTLLRQAFTHGSYVDAAMQSVNTAEATLARVRLGHVFPNVGQLKRKRTAFLQDNNSSSTQTTSEVQRISEQHLGADFVPQFHSKFLCPYERLEFLGDAVLSFLVASSAFLKLPTADGEGVLHQTRVDVASNEALGRVARDANFDALVLTAFNVATLDESLKTKIAADCLEALLGAVFTDQGVDACRALLVALMDRFDPNVRELYLLDTDELTQHAAAYVAQDRERFKQWPTARDARLRHRQFTTSAATSTMAVRHTHLWLQALTHKSFKPPQMDAEVDFLTSDASYERVEFLGDAVLQLLSSAFLVDALPHHQEHLLTNARSSLVKNTQLARVARKLGMEEYVRLGSEAKKTGMLYMDDVLADVFEATLGVVFLENVRDLGKVRVILEGTVFPLIKESLQRREWMNPEKILLHHLAKWGGRGREIKCECKKIPSRRENEHCVALFVNGFCVARASGRTIQEAKNAACRRALHLYGISLHPRD